MRSIIEIADERKEFVTGDDGYVMYWPNKQFGGGLSAHNLRELADELDRRNADWDKEIEDYFYGQETN